MHLHGDDSRLDEIMPDKWAANHPESVLTYRIEESGSKEHAPPPRSRNETDLMIGDRTPCLGRTLTDLRHSRKRAGTTAAATCTAHHGL